MKIRMLVHVAGPDFDVPAGGVTERFSDEEAGRYIRSGQAVLVEAQQIETTAKAPAAETRIKRKAAQG